MLLYKSATPSQLSIIMVASLPQDRHRHCLEEASEDLEKEVLEDGDCQQGCRGSRKKNPRESGMGIMAVAFLLMQFLFCHLTEVSETSASLHGHAITPIMSYRTVLFLGISYSTGAKTVSSNQSITFINFLIFFYFSTSDPHFSIGMKKLQA